MYYELKAKDIQQNTDILVRLHGEFAYFFRTSTRNVAPHALDYLKGQLLLESRRNMSRMSVEVVDEDEQSLSHFISNSPWEDEPLIEAIGKRAVELLSQGGVSGAFLPAVGRDSGREWDSQTRNGICRGRPSVLWSAGEGGQLSSGGISGL